MLMNSKGGQQFDAGKQPVSIPAATEDDVTGVAEEKRAMKLDGAGKRKKFHRLPPNDGCDLVGRSPCCSAQPPTRATLPQVQLSYSLQMSWPDENPEMKSEVSC